MVGEGSGEVSAVTRLRMTSMVEEPHVHSLNWNFVWSVYQFVCPTGDDRSQGRGEDRGPWRALITQDKKQSPLDTKSTGQRPHLPTRK